METVWCLHELESVVSPGQMSNFTRQTKLGELIHDKFNVWLNWDRLKMQFKSSIVKFDVWPEPVLLTRSESIN